MKIKTIIVIGTMPTFRLPEWSYEQHERQMKAFFYKPCEPAHFKGNASKGKKRHNMNHVSKRTKMRAKRNKN